MSSPSPLPSSAPPPPPRPRRHERSRATGTNPLAIVSLIAAIVMPGLGSIAAVILGHMALGQIRTSGQDGRGLAIAGLVIGYLGLLAMLLGILLVVSAAGGSSPFIYELK